MLVRISVRRATRSIRQFSTSRPPQAGFFKRLFGDVDHIGSEIHIGNGGDKSNHVPLSDIQTTILSQDPNRRIRFAYPHLFDGKYLTQDWQRNMYIRSAFRQLMPATVESISVELLPFWEMAWLMDTELTELFMWPSSEDGKKRGKTRTVVEPYTVVFTCNICAAPIHHWAHGLMLEDSMHRMPRHNWAHVSTSSDISIYATKQPYDYNPVALELLKPDVDPSVAQAFAFGPPLFRQTPQDVLVDSLATEYDLGDGGAITVSLALRKRITSFAFPNYRLVYKANMSDGTVAFADASNAKKAFAATIVPADETYPVNRRGPDSTLTGARREDGVPNLFYAYRRHRGNDDVITWGLSGSRIDVFQTAVVQEMQNTPLAWNDPGIFAMYDSTAGEGQEKQADMIFTYIQDSLLDKNPTLPQFVSHQPNAPARLSSHLLNRAKGAGAGSTSRPQPNPQPKPEPENNDDGRHRHRIRTRGAADVRTSRDRLINDRLKSTITNQRAWAKRGEAPVMAAKAAVAPKVVVTDRRKHYEILGIKPRLELISAESADKVNDELKAVLYALTRRHHPDLASSPADEDARHNRMSKINVAYAHVETLALRRHYHDPFVFPNPNKK